MGNLSQLPEYEPDAKFLQVAVKVAALLKADQGHHGDDHDRGFDGKDVVDNDGDDGNDENDDSYL